MINIIKDSNFELGFMLKGLNSLKDGHASIKDYKFTNADPVWYLCQWNSKYNLIDKEFCKGDCGKKVLEDASKRLTITKDGLIFKLDASKEYSRPRLPNEAWPHLLIEQDITENNKVENMSKLVLSGSFKLNILTDYMQGKAEDWHTAQFVWVVVMKNGNKNSLDYNEFMWVVIGLYDSRYEYVPLYCAQDKALPDGDFIYSFGGEDFLPQSMNSKAEVNVNFDLYPHIEKMLSVAKKSGYLINTNSNDLIIASTNMGFEVTGTYDVEVEVKNMSICVDNVKEEKRNAQ